MPIPSLQLRKKTSLMQRSAGFGHGVVVSKICYNLLIVLLCDCCKLLAFRGWKRGCQPFSCPRSQSVTHCRKEIFHTCLFQEFRPFVKSKSPLQPCIMVASFPSLRCSCEKKPVSCKEAEGLVTQLWCPGFVTLY